MKTINVAELKTHLSRYLRAVRAGERFVVLDRRTPVAELVPPPRAEGTPWERLAREEGVRLGTQDWGALELMPLKKEVPIQQLLRQVREDGA